MSETGDSQTAYVHGESLAAWRLRRRPNVQLPLVKRLLANLGLLVAGLGVALLLGEALVRLTVDVPVTPQMFLTDPLTDFRLKPNVHERLSWPGGVSFSWTTNSRGYRATPELVVPKPPSTKRVLLLGDSFTFGQGVNDSQTFAAEAQRRLRELCPGRALEIVNAGVPGFSTSQELALLEGEGLALDPDIVVLGFYGNDPQDNLQRGVFFLAGDTLVRRPSAARPRFYRVKQFIDKVPGYPWLVAHSHLVNLVRRAYVAATAENAASAAFQRAWASSATAEDAGSGEATEERYSWQLMRALLEQMRTSTERADARLVVFLIPDTADVRRVSVQRDPIAGETPVERMRTLCSDVGLECLDLARWLGSSGRAVSEEVMYIPGEYHFTAAGNALAGEFLASRLAAVLGCESGSRW
jgi:hypothetical protein